MWKCSCGCINAGIINNGICAASKTWKNVEHSQISENTLDSLRIWKARKEITDYSMTPQEELFATYYNRGKILVKDMDDTTLREHRMQLQEIATEAKAQLLAADDEIRERQAKKGNRNWLVTTDTSTSVSDAINAPRQRAVRMSKMDKLKKQLSFLDEDIVNEMIRNLERKATDKGLKTITFNKPSTETTVVQVESTNGSPAAFDPSKLFGSKE